MKQLNKRMTIAKGRSIKTSTGAEVKLKTPSTLGAMANWCMTKGMGTITHITSNKGRYNKVHIA